MKKTPKAAKAAKVTKATKSTKSITTPAFKEILGLLYKYELKHGAGFHPNSDTVKLPHWFKVTLYSDGSGRVMDSCTQQEMFMFNDINELEEKLKL